MPAQQDSYAPIVYTVRYRQTPDGPYILLPTYHMFQSFTVEMAGGGGSWIGSLVLFDRTGKFMGTNLTPRPGSVFEVAWGWDDGQPQSMQTYVGNVAYVEPKFSAHGTTEVVHLWGHHSEEVQNKAVGPRSFPAGMLYSDIVQQIATAMNWKITAIEPTINKTPDALRMGSESYAKFFKNAISTKASNGQTHEKYEFFWDWDIQESGGGVHFHTPSYQVRKGIEAGRALTLAREYVYYADMVGEVLAFEPTDNTFFNVVFDGGGDSDHHSAASKPGDHIIQKSDHKSGVTDKRTNLKGTPPATAAAVAHTDLSNPKNAPNSQHGWICRSADELNDTLLSYIAWIRQQNYPASLTVKGTHDIIPWDWIALKYYTFDHQEHFLSGIYRVETIAHTLDSGSWKTKFGLVRVGRGAPKGDKTSIQQVPTVTLPLTPQVNNPVSQGQALFGPQ